MTGEDLFAPIDRLHRVVGAAMELEEAEELLRATGLRMLANSWMLLGDEGSGGPMPVRIAEAGATR